MVLLYQFNRQLILLLVNLPSIADCESTTAITTCTHSSIIFDRIARGTLCFLDCETLVCLYTTPNWLDPAIIFLITFHNFDIIHVLYQNYSVAISIS